MQGGLVRIQSVCLSVRLSVKRVHCDETEERLGQIFIPYEKHVAQFYEKKMVGAGRPLLPEIFGQPAPVGAKSLILNRYLLVAPQPYHIAKINTNRKSTTRFLMSLR